MHSSPITIELPSAFSNEHERIVIAYLMDRLSGREDWALAFTAFDLLDQAVVSIANQRMIFRVFYRQFIDHKYADEYIGELLSLRDVKEQSPALWAQFARRIVSDSREQGWQRADVPGNRLLLSYLLYWWGAFARGYAFEVEVFRDLQRSGIQFTAHDLRDRPQRFSPSDLTVSGMAGDIKTSAYFIQVAAPLKHDFYIVRVFVRGQSYTLVVFLQPAAWDTINGDTVEGKLDNITQNFPLPVRIEYRGHELVVLEYEEWKRRVLRQQGATG